MFYYILPFNFVCDYSPTEIKKKFFFFFLQNVSASCLFLIFNDMLRKESPTLTLYNHLVPLLLFFLTLGFTSGFYYLIVSWLSWHVVLKNPYFVLWFEVPSISCIHWFVGFLLSDLFVCFCVYIELFITTWR